MHSIICCLCGQRSGKATLLQLNPRRQVDLRRIHSNSTGYIVKETENGAYDWLYVLHEANCEYLVKTCFVGRHYVTLRDADKVGAVAESGRMQLP